MQAVNGLLLAGLLAGPDQVAVETEFDRRIPKPVQSALASSADAVLDAHGVEVGDAEGQRTITLKVRKQARDYTVTARVLSPEGTVEREAVRTCTICRHAELTKTVTEAVEAISDVFERGTLSIVSKPSGATVWIGDDQVGQTPLEVPLPAGEYEVTLDAEGRHPAFRDVEVSAGEETREAFNLRLALRGGAEEGVGWGAVGLGGVAMISGIVALTIRNPRVGLGGGLIGAGVVLGAGGGVLVWHGRKRARAQAPEARLGPAAVQLRF